LGPSTFTTVFRICVVTDDNVVKDCYIAVETNDVSRETGSEYRRITNGFPFSGRVIYTDFCLGPFLPFRLLGIDHVGPVETVIIGSENVLNELQLFNGEV
jgi:hypothetical protein